MRQHPVDRLIRDLIQTGRSATLAEVSQILDRMATAPFNSAQVTVPDEDRGRSYQGRTLGIHADSLEYHLLKRVVIEEQWADSATAAQYFADLQRAVQAPDARLVVYRSRSGHLAATLTPVDSVLPLGRRGVRTEREILVVYSADRGVIITGYQVSGLDTTRIPQDAQWLK